MKAYRWRVSVLVFVIALSLLLTACGGSNGGDGASSSGVDTSSEVGDTSSDVGDTSSEVEPTETLETSDFSAFTAYEYSFSSGAGAWSTDLTLDDDGSFKGVYHDANMGESGEGYDATIYACEFLGQFTDLTEIADKTYTVKLDSYEFLTEEGTSEVIDRVNYVYTTWYGMNDTETFTLYLPRADLTGLSEDALRWVFFFDDIQETADFAVIVNDDQQFAFRGYTPFEEGQGR